MSVKPIFVLSLPRSGSTLLQRVLATHPSISTASEPWILLPLVYARRTSGSAAEYHQQDSAAAINDFVETLDNSDEDYWRAAREFALSLYASSATEGATYFVDKTPRYHLITNELFRTFPDAKFIFLWRNPLAVAASMMSTWSNGNWNLHRFEIDLFEGVQSLLAARNGFAEQSLSIRFEDLVSSPGDIYPRLFEYLELEAESASVENFSEVRLEGRMGDPTGVHQYQKIESDRRDSWPEQFNNVIRRRWAQNYLNWLGEEHLATMGYDKGKILNTLTQDPTSLRNLASDAGRLIYRKLRPTPEQRELHQRRNSSS